MEKRKIMSATMIFFSIFALESSSIALSKENRDAIFLINSLDNNDLSGSLAKYIKKQLSRPRYFESSCLPIKKDNPLYPNIPYKECTYTESKMVGWVQLAVIPPEMISGWITNSCAEAQSKLTCVSRVAAYMWDSNQYSYPIVGNIIEPANSAGGTGTKALNLIFLHGITIPRPTKIPAVSVAAAVQKAELEKLAQSAEGYQGKTMQVSRPAGIRREIYTQYAKEFSELDVGASCPDAENVRKSAWLDASRRSLVEAWNKPKHRLVDALAKALEQGKFPGRVDCQ